MALPLPTPHRTGLRKPLGTEERAARARRGEREGSRRPALHGNQATGALATERGGTERGSRTAATKPRDSCFCARTLRAWVPGLDWGFSPCRLLGDATTPADPDTFVTPPWKPRRTGSRSSPRPPRSGTCPGRRRPGCRGEGAGRSGRPWSGCARGRAAPRSAVGGSRRGSPPHLPTPQFPSVLFMTFARSACSPPSRSFYGRRERLSHLGDSTGV